MNRRNMISGLGALAALPLLARNSAAQSADTGHLQQTATVGSLSLLVSRLALTKVQSPKLLQFAKFEVAEQNTISDIIKGVLTGTTSGKVVPPTDDEAKSHLDAKGQADYQKLKGLSGKVFEKAYIQAEIEGHQKLLSIQTSYLASGSNREHLDVAKLAKGMIEEHLTLLNDLHIA